MHFEQMLQKACCNRIAYILLRMGAPFGNERPDLFRMGFYILRYPDNRLPAWV